ncbi:MAG: hypothetical protein ABII00_13620 [Elusimicrobiota bacterium]
MIAPDPFEELESDLRETGVSDLESAAGTPSRMREGAGEPSDLPTFVSFAESIHEFGRFADGGSDSNWYIGFNNAWIVKLPPAPVGDFGRAFIGAKVGRAKTRPRKDRPWERDVMPGKIYMGIAPRPAFSSEQSFFLVETKDVPREPHESLYLEGTGRSEWFWAEVPLSLVSVERANYLIIWSPTREFRSADVAPILAAGNGSAGGKGEVRAWNNHEIQGVPPRVEEDALKTPINLKPAMAIKLVPRSSSAARVSVTGFSTRSLGERLMVWFSAEGKNVELAWVEMSQDELEWSRVSAYRRSPPYVFTLPRSELPSRGAYLRGKARDVSANEGAGGQVFVVGEGVR